MVNRTRVEGGGYSKHDIITSVGKKNVMLYKYQYYTRFPFGRGVAQGSWYVPLFYKKMLVLDSM